METPSSDKPGELVWRAFASYVAASYLTAAMFTGVFLFAEAGRAPIDASILSVILLGPIIVPVSLLGGTSAWLAGARQGNQIWWMLPVFATIWAGCFVLIGRWMGSRNHV